MKVNKDYSPWKFSRCLLRFKLQIWIPSLLKIPPSLSRAKVPHPHIHVVCDPFFYSSSLLSVPSFSFFLISYSFFYPCVFLSFNPLSSSAASFTDCNPVCVRSPACTHTPLAENAVSISPLRSMPWKGREGARDGGEDGWVDGWRWRGEKDGERQGKETKGDY